MSNGRAKVGGETGVNGEYYKGGKFLPSTHRPKGIPNRNAKTCRALVAPGVLADVPAGMLAIFEKIRVFVSDNGVGGLCIMRHLDAPESACWQHYGPYEHIQSLVSQYNNGERFVAA